MKCILSGFLPVIENEKVEENDAKFEFVMLALRTAEGISAKKYTDAFGSDWKKDFSAAYEKNRTYFTENGDRTAIKEEFLYVQNHILTDFME